MMQSPAQGVHRDLIPHVHCLSTSRYPIQQQVHQQQIIQWLREAPDISQTKAPFFWTYLDRPADGQIFLSWQPLEALGTGSATDGYIWPPQEQGYQIEIEGGYILEHYTHKNGFVLGEQFTSHARHRYRLLPPRIPNNGPPVDPSLWVTHYTASDPNDRIPSNMIPINDSRTQHMISQRNYLQQQGAIIKKEFMLRDSSHWPQIQWPHSQGPPRGSYSGATRTPQSMAYPPQSSGPPAKRARTNVSTNSQTNLVQAGVEDEEEETSRGDLFDMLTPRDISLMRYKQNHRWMDELVSSPYSIHQITPVDLGLGLKGGLNGLTDGIFQAPTGDPEDDPHQYDYVGQLDPGKAEDFRKRVNERIANDNAELERMKAKHAKRMARVKKGALVVAAEKSLRTAVHDPSDIGTELWRLEGRVDEAGEEGQKTVPNVSGKVDDIVAKVEASLGRRATAIQELRCVQDGGLEETVVPSVQPSHSGSRNGSQQSGILINAGDMDMGESAAGLLDQYQTGFSAGSTPPLDFSNPQAQAYPGSGSSQIPPSQTAPQASVQATSPIVKESIDTDSMQGMQSNPPAADLSKDTETSEDWVVVPKGGITPPAPTEADSTTSQGATSIPAVAPTQSVAPPAQQTVTANTGSIPIALDPNAPYIVSEEFLNMDGTGDALAFGGDGAHDAMDLDLDDSAFGDAFHGVETHTEDAAGDDAL